MPSKLAKVQKRVGKKKGGAKLGALHENSRDAQRLRRAGARDERVARLSAIREKANRSWIERVLFFQDNLPESLQSVPDEEVRDLIEMYIARVDDELEQLRAERRPGRPASNRQVLLEQQRRIEDGEYDSGFWVPNLQDHETLLLLQSWNGEWVGLAQLKYVRITKGGDIKESQFPPKGSS